MKRRSSEAAVAVVNEVLTGDRFFKFRILDEERVRKQLIATWPDATSRPTLVFGHSHEMRLNAWSEAGGEAFGPYLNTASAGRFENLMWAVEIEDGKARMVSWSRAEPPSGPVVRRVWSEEVDDHGRSWARASRDPVPLGG